MHFQDEIFDHFVQNGGFKMGHRIPLKRRPNDLLVWLLWFVSLVVPLMKYLVTVIVSGSLMLKATIVLIVLLGEPVLSWQGHTNQPSKSSTFDSA